MEDKFDAFAKALASGVSRREALRRLGGGLAGGLLALVGLGQSKAHAISIVTHQACLTACDQTYNTCTAYWGQGNQVCLAMNESRFRACKSACPPNTAATQRCVQECELSHEEGQQQCTIAYYEKLNNCVDTRDQCRLGCPP